jgi:hypothetical protein
MQTMQKLHSIIFPKAYFFPATAALKYVECVGYCRYINTAVEVDTDKPVLVDKYLDRAIELDVDALRDQEGNIVICGIMEHIEQVRPVLCC